MLTKVMLTTILAILGILLGALTLILALGICCICIVVYWGNFLATFYLPTQHNPTNPVNGPSGDN